MKFGKIEKKLQRRQLPEEGHSLCAVANYFILWLFIINNRLRMQTFVQNHLNDFSVLEQAKNQYNAEKVAANIHGML